MNINLNLKKALARVSIVFFIIVCIAIIYNYSINKYIKVVRENINIENLPEEFSGFKILQITDLHSKNFGKKNINLINKINSLDYDIIVFTGEMANEGEDGYSPFFDLVSGLENKEEMYYVSGNNGPFVFENEGLRFYYSDEKLRISEVGEEIENLGIKLMDNVYKIQRGNSTLWISEMISNKEFYEKAKGFNKGDIRISITHYPMNEEYYEKIRARYEESIDVNELNDSGGIIPQYDLILAGHYHGGQWRLPFVGAFFISDVYGDCWFPDEERVSGLTQWGGFNQYVSRGLWASGHPLVRFRLFNQPEINLITISDK